MSHYDFLDEHLDALWKQATGKTINIRVPYIAILHVPTATITSQFEDDGISAKLRLKDIYETLDNMPEDERAQYKIIRYICENDPFFTLLDAVNREAPSSF